MNIFLAETFITEEISNYTIFIKQRDKLSVIFL